MYWWSELKELRKRNQAWNPQHQQELNDFILFIIERDQWTFWNNGNKQFGELHSKQAELSVGVRIFGTSALSPLLSPLCKRRSYILLKNGCRLLKLLENRGYRSQCIQIRSQTCYLCPTRIMTQWARMRPCPAPSSRTPINLDLRQMVAWKHGSR